MASYSDGLRRLWPSQAKSALESAGLYDVRIFERGSGTDFEGSVGGHIVRFRLTIPVGDLLEPDYVTLRRLLRALTQLIRAKFDAIELGFATFEDEFRPYVVLPRLAEE